MQPSTIARVAGLNRLKACVGNVAARRGLTMLHPPNFENEKSLNYAKGSPERAQLTQSIRQLKSELPVTIPIKISGTEIETKESRAQPNPSKHREIVANYASATPAQVDTAIDAALKAKPAWESMQFEDRAAIFLRACELIAGKYRSELVAATMIGQGKNIWQAEIDAAAETVDFFRYYIQEAWALYSQQPTVQPNGTWNKMEYRPLEGFIYAIAPFNFTALGATLVGPAALLGNVVIWKPSDSALHASWILHKILLEAGLPKDVIQFLPGDAEEVTNTVLKRPEFGALTFIGATATFKGIQKKIGDGIGQGIYNSYPRVVGETGGKNWGVVHPSADVRSAALNTIRAAFEYQGQKCSANSRVYIAESVWPEFQQVLTEETSALKIGNVEDYSNFINPVIHERSFDKLNAFIEDAKSDSELELIVGGQASKQEGYYVHPTVYRTSNPRHEIMSRELFGPILGVYVYPDTEWEQTLKLIDTTSRYGLTGSIFAKDPYASRQAQTILKHAAGMLYLNTKCTGSTVAQQPFGGSRDSGTNDKTGTMAHLQRFVSTRTIKEEFVPLEKVLYPSNEA
ncbi:delta-1-pyrroline-5-carboxylate dehydrogenase [Penicillium hispanicum]|uniref:delta-1-pyrroline-5-carboxylate dehydrogenase n=1 Tax=Penicillium hispanicum TaxID=1080232 RepID=UPI00254171C3|nr:delta-1-pyrroline-5-carboxylate dehydrogenase [Penicillium hispanicum]KAJ5584934.1 delta-1-pyrroline-5-carboxylate dehydrogenase [Penicillium hispanicum]